MTLNFSQFLDNWPESRKDQFSYDAMQAIFDYYENIAEETGEDVEYDPIAICCEWSEHNSAVEAIKDHGYDCDYDLSGTDEQDKEAEKEKQALEFLNDHTTVLELDKGVVLIQF